MRHEAASKRHECQRKRRTARGVVAVGICGALVGVAMPAVAGTLGEFGLDELPQRPVATVRIDSSPAELSARLAQVLPTIFENVVAEGRVPGLVFTRTWLAESDRLFLEAGIELDDALGAAIETPVGVIEPGTIPAQRVATVDHYGPYQELSSGHSSLREWWAPQGLTAAGPPLEYYVTDPTTEPDQNQWLTRIHHPVIETSALKEGMEFLVGRWVGRQGAAFIEESWQPFEDGETLGTFRMRRNGKPSFYEFQTIDMGAGSTARVPELRIKHFSPGLVAWEEKDESVRFTLALLLEGQMVWVVREGERLSQLTYTLNVGTADGSSGSERLSIVLSKWGAGKPASATSFEFQRAEF